VEIADRSTVDYRVNIAMTSSYNGSFSSTEHEVRWNIIKSRIRDNSVIIVTRMRARLSWNPERGKTYCLHQNIQTGPWSHPTSYSKGIMGNGGSSPRVKRPVREANHPSQPSAEIKNMWCCKSAPPICLYGT
jgi:hypothetical protein